MNIKAEFPSEAVDHHFGKLSEESRRADPLSGALLYLAAFHGRTLSRGALLSGLPILDDQLNARLFGRAARRAGLEAEPVKRSLADIPSLVCPAVLVMLDGSARILLRNDPGAHVAIVADPTEGIDAAVLTLPYGDISTQFSGFVFLVRPAATANARTNAAGDVPPPHWFWPTVVKFAASYSHIAIAAVVINLLALTSPLFVMNVYDRVVPNGAIPSLIALSIGLVIAIVFDFAFRVIRSRIIDMTGKTIDVALAAEIFEHVQALKLTQRPKSVGVLANQLRDFDSVREFFTSGTVISVTDLLFGVLFVVALFVISGPLAWIPLLMLPVMVIVGLLLQRPLGHAMRRLQVGSSARHGVLIEALGNIESIRALNAEERIQKVWERSVAATARAGEDVHFWSALAQTASSTAQQAVSLMMMVIGVFLIIDGKLSLGALVAATMLAGRVLAPIASVSTVIMRATQITIAFKAIDRVMGLDRERQPDRVYVSRQIVEGRIAFDNVTFRYPDGIGNALENVSFGIGPGERVGIIGRVGSGKTTVGRLLAGFYDPREGSIRVDGVDVRQYDPADLRAGIGFVLQDIDLFHGRLRDNITLGKPAASDDEVLAAAQLAGVERFAAGHPLGYAMPIQEGGRSLSGGQKQAIGLARVLIRKPKLIFLDEPTAHFDVRSEDEFIERLKALADERLTVVISTHRHSLLQFVDRILVFDAGRLVADGPRKKIMAMLSPGDQPAESPAPAVRQPVVSAL